jgi:DegV family protein with EDD domain
VDYLAGEMQRQKIYCVPIKRIHGDKVYEEIYENAEQFDEFYEGVKQGKLSSTSQINTEEFIEYFNSILEKEKEGDIIHITLSSGLSGTYNCAVLAANELNETLKGRRIYPIDSLSATVGMMILTDKLLELNGSVSAKEAVKTVEELRDTTQVFFMVDDLNHLKRGGRLSAAKALIGTILGVKPILTLNKYGKIVPVEKAKGNQKAINTIMALSQKHCDKQNPEFKNATVYLVRTSKSDTYEKLREIIKETYPKINIREAIIGPVVGSHLGCGAVGFVFQGAARLDPH